MLEIRGHSRCQDVGPDRRTKFGMGTSALACVSVGILDVYGYIRHVEFDLDAGEPGHSVGLSERQDIWSIGQVGAIFT
jgi:hypothetical protein